MNRHLADKGYAVFDLANEYGERREKADTLTHLAVGCPVSYTVMYNSKYPAAGNTTLTDGLQGGWTYGDRRWQGWSEDMDLTIDLGKTDPLYRSFVHAFRRGLGPSAGAGDLFCQRKRNRFHGSCDDI